MHTSCRSKAKKKHKATLSQQMPERLPPSSREAWKILQPFFKPTAKEEAPYTHSEAKNVRFKMQQKMIEKVHTEVEKITAFSGSSDLMNREFSKASLYDGFSVDTKKKWKRSLKPVKKPSSPSPYELFSYAQEDDDEKFIKKVEDDEKIITNMEDYTGDKPHTEDSEKLNIINFAEKTTQDGAFALSTHKFPHSLSHHDHETRSIASLGRYKSLELVYSDRMKHDLEKLNLPEYRYSGVYVHSMNRRKEDIADENPHNEEGEYLTLLQNRRQGFITGWEERRRAKKEKQGSILDLTEQEKDEDPTIDLKQLEASFHARLDSKVSKTALALRGDEYKALWTNTPRAKTPVTYANENVSKGEKMRAEQGKSTKATHAHTVNEEEAKEEAERIKEESCTYIPKTGKTSVTPLQGTLPAFRANVEARNGSYFPSLRGLHKTQSEDCTRRNTPENDVQFAEETEAAKRRGTHKLDDCKLLKGSRRLSDAWKNENSLKNAIEEEANDAKNEKKPTFSTHYRENPNCLTVNPSDSSKLSANSHKIHTPESEIFNEATRESGILQERGRKEINLHTQEEEDTSYDIHYPSICSKYNSSQHTKAWHQELEKLTHYSFCMENSPSSTQLSSTQQSRFLESPYFISTTLRLQAYREANCEPSYPLNSLSTKETFVGISEREKTRKSLASSFIEAPVCETPPHDRPRYPCYDVATLEEDVKEGGRNDEHNSLSFLPNFSLQNIYKQFEDIQASVSSKYFSLLQRTNMMEKNSVKPAPPRYSLFSTMNEAKNLYLCCSIVTLDDECRAAGGGVGGGWYDERFCGAGGGSRPQNFY